MKFRTEIEIPKTQTPIEYSTKILSLGSCFAQSIGRRLQESKFSTCVNPVGTLFNPLSICSTIARLSECRLVEAHELQRRGDEWFHFDFHSSLSDVAASAALAKINSAVECGAKALEECDLIFITLGTVWVYELAESREVVANCHKLPSKCFVRRAMSVEEVVDSLAEQVENYPTKRFIFSVSPVRHLADGLAENALSKSTLRVALSLLVERYDNVAYFPSYEIMLDDLRDYRFYADDMLHPSPQAIEYIWSKFSDSQLDSSTCKTMELVEAIVRAAAHRPFNVANSAHQIFCRKQLELIKEYPMIDFGKEYAYFMSQLQNNL